MEHKLEHWTVELFSRIDIEEPMLGHLERFKEKLKTINKLNKLIKKIMQSNKISHINKMNTSFKLFIMSIAFCFNLAINISTHKLFAQKQNIVELTKKIDIPVIELKGDAYARGLQHGTQLKNEINDVFMKWKLNIKKTIKSNPDSLLTTFLKASNFKPTILKHTPELMDELKGIADGSGQSFDDVFAFQLVDEFWVYLDKQLNIKNHHCSSLGVASTKNHPAYIAQNVDLETYMNNYQVLLHINATKNEPEQYILSCAGLIGINGANESGIGVCVNTLMELQASSDGLPVAFIIRALLKIKDGEDVLEFIKNVKHASGQNYILGIIDNIYDFEASANQVVRFIPEKGKDDIVYHTNHALVNHDVKEWYKEYHQRILFGKTKSRNTQVRYASLENRLNFQPENVSLDVIKMALKSKDDKLNPVCIPFDEKGGGFTFSSVVFTLGNKRSVQLTYGSPDQSEYHEYFFKH